MSARDLAAVVVFVVIWVPVLCALCLGVGLSYLAMCALSGRWIR